MTHSSPWLKIIAVSKKAALISHKPIALRSAYQFHKLSLYNQLHRCKWMCPGSFGKFRYYCRENCCKPWLLKTNQNNSMYTIQNKLYMYIRSMFDGGVLDNTGCQPHTKPAGTWIGHLHDRVQVWWLLSTVTAAAKTKEIILQHIKRYSGTCVWVPSCRVQLAMVCA